MTASELFPALKKRVISYLSSLYVLAYNPQQRGHLKNSTVQQFQVLRFLPALHLRCFLGRGPHKIAISLKSLSKMPRGGPAPGFSGLQMEVVPFSWPQALWGWCLQPGLGAKLLVLDSVQPRNIRTNLRQKDVPISPLYVIACIYQLVQPKLDKLDAPGAASR